MRQHPRVESPVEVSQPLHPVLSNALASLDIQLEEELARYRRMKAMPDRVPRRTGRYAPNRSLDLISVSAVGGRTHPTEPVRQTETPVNENNGDVSVDPIYGAVAPAIASVAHSSDLAISPQHQESSAIPGSEPESTLSQEQIEAIVKPLNPQGLDDYLESSEELLRSLAEEEAAVQAERGFVQSLLTPLGMGSMLLLLLSSAMFGYLVMNPSSLGRLFASPNASQDGTPNGQAAQTEGISPQPNLATKEFKDLNLDTLGTLKTDSAPVKRSNMPTAPTASSPTVPGRPTIAAPSSGMSGNPTDAATAPNAGGSYSGSRSAPLTSQPEPAPVAPSQPAPSVRTYNPPQPARSYASPSRSTPSRVNTPPPPTTNSYSPPVVKSPSPANAASPETRTSASGSYDYKVVIPYDSDRTLETVKESVPDAYLRNFPDGARIQTGAYSSETDAQRQVQELRNQGISAEVYKP